jgi:hypothetical protein
MILLLILFMAQQPAPPAVDEILQRYEAAVGDPVVARAHESRIIRSVYEDVSGSEAEIFEYYFAPNQYLHTMVLAEGFVMRMGTDGKIVWNQGPRGIESVPADKMPPVARDAAFNRHLRLRELYEELRVVGAANVAGKPAWHVEATSADGEKEQMYFDAASGLLVRRTYVYVLPDGFRAQRDFLYEEYADFGGLRMPSVIRQFAPAAAVIRVTRVDHNADVHPWIFRLPQCGEKKQ